MHRCLALVALLVLGACSHPAQVSVAPAEPVYSDYDRKLPGRYALYVDAQAAGQERQLQCGFHSLTFDARGPFRQSVLITVRDVVEEVVPVERPLPAAELAAQGYDGQIRIEASDIDVEFYTIDRGVYLEAHVEVELDARLRVDSPERTVLDRVVSAEGEGEADAGIVCSGADGAVSAALTQSLQLLARRLGEPLANEIGPHAEVRVPPAREPLPGRYAFAVEAEAMSEYWDSLTRCSWIEPKFDARQMLHDAAHETFAELVEELVPVPGALAPEALRERGLDRQIVVTAEAVDVDFRSIGTMWSPRISIDTELQAGLRVYGPEGGLLGRTATVEAEGPSDAGFSFCTDAPPVMLTVSERAIRRVLEPLAEAFRTSGRLRGVQSTAR
jgi:hypothetical protein